MRTLPNELLSTDSSDETLGSVRKCILTGARAPRDMLIRLALGPAGGVPPSVLPDVRAKAPGRGAWIGVSRAELEIALAKGKLKGLLTRAFKTGEFQLSADLPALIAAQLERMVLDRLGLEAKAGQVVIGHERIDKAARSGKLHLLLHAADAGADGSRKLDQAWRVGREAEGSSLRGCTLPLGRATLSMALGRENVVHIGIADPGAAGRLRAAIDRWLHYLGPELAGAACETSSQGATALLNGGATGATARDIVENI